jgi:hypothetical protein
MVSFENVSTTLVNDGDLFVFFSFLTTSTVGGISAILPSKTANAPAIGIWLILFSVKAGFHIDWPV